MKSIYPIDFYKQFYLSLACFHCCRFASSNLCSMEPFLGNSILSSNSTPYRGGSVKVKRKIVKSVQSVSKRYTKWCGFVF